MLHIDSHPTLDLLAFTTEFPAPLGTLESSADLLELLQVSSDSAPLRSNDEVRKQVRNLLRHGGFKPTGRNKPASEYLIKAVQEGLLAPINLAVDACNAVSFHSGLPISVVDADKLSWPLCVKIAPESSEYVFNPTGHTLKLDGLLCLFDAIGPCANAVKDSQRTKTDKHTTRTLSVIWGTTALPGRTVRAGEWYKRLLQGTGATTSSPE